MDSPERPEPRLYEMRRRVPWGPARQMAIYPTPLPGARQTPRIVQTDRNAGPLRLGLRSSWHEDLYHQAIVLPWWQFLVLGGVIYLVLNLVFAGLFLLDPTAIDKARPGHFEDAFFFSVQTMATIGYGVLTPVGTYANLVVTAETMVSLLFTAFTTGLTFARFSRPTARVNFSRVATISPYNGVPTLAVRMTNARQNQILEADVSMTMLRSELSSEGRPMRRFYDLTLARPHTPIFALSFTAMHPIDEHSPLHGATRESLEAAHAEILVTVTGLDGTMTQTIHARASYRAEEIVIGQRFADIFGYTEDGRVVIDLDRFHEVEPVE